MNENVLWEDIKGRLEVTLTKTWATVEWRVTPADVQRNKTLVFHPDTFQAKPKEHFTRVLMTLVISDAM